MLDDNTNKVVWIGVAVGVVALIGLAASQMFPGVFGNMKTKMTDLMNNFAKPADDVTGTI